MRVFYSRFCLPAASKTRLLFFSKKHVGQPYFNTRKLLLFKHNTPMSSCATIAISLLDFNPINQERLLATTLENDLLKNENARLLERIRKLECLVGDVIPTVSSSVEEIEEIIAQIPTPSPWRKTVPLVKDCSQKVQTFFATNLVRLFLRNAGKILNRRLQPGAHFSKCGTMVPLGSCNPKQLHRWFVKYKCTASSRKFKLERDGKKIFVERKYYKFTNKTRMPPIMKSFWIRSFNKKNESSGIRSIFRSFYSTITFVVCQESHRVFANFWQTTQCSNNGGKFFNTS